MSIEAISWVIKQDIPDGVAKLVAMVLADYADRHTGEAHPKIRQLAQACSQSERSVQRKLRVLQDLNVITIQLGHCPRSGRQRANSYILHLPGVEVPDRPEPPARGDHLGAGSGDDGPRGDFGAPLFSGEGCPSVTGEGDNAVTGEGDSPVTPIGNPSDSTVRTESPQPPGAGGRRASPIVRGNPGAQPVRLAADRSEAPRPVLDDAAAARFERLWAAYPADGLAYSDRLAAERLFAGLDADDQALAVTAAGGYRAQLARTVGGKPIRAKALQGWLRQRRFTNLRVVASSAAAPSARVFVRDGTPEWAAWEAHDRAQGRVPRNAYWSETERAMGCWFASARPPASASAA